MNEYVIHAKLKNNLVLSRILRDYANVNQFCAVHGMSPTAVGNLINMKVPAIYAEGSRNAGEWTHDASRLAEALGEIPDDLFTDEQRQARLKSNEAFIGLSTIQALSMADPLKQFEDGELVRRIMDESNLTPRERRILEVRHLKEMTVTETAAMFDVTPARVQQIERRCFLKMRFHSKTVHDLRPKQETEPEEMEAEHDVE